MATRGYQHIQEYEEESFLWGAVKLENYVFSPVPPRSEKCKRAHSENGKRHADNL